MVLLIFARFLLAPPFPEPAKAGGRRALTPHSWSQLLGWADVSLGLAMGQERFLKHFPFLLGAGLALHQCEL